jgi:hypothetical protein
MGTPNPTDRRFKSRTAAGRGGGGGHIDGGRDAEDLVGAGESLEDSRRF